MKYNIEKKINKEIFRGYDIRAIYGTQLTEDTAYTIGLAFGTYVQNKGFKNCVVGHDARESSDSLTNALLTGILETGLNVSYIGLVTTPMYYFAQKNLNIEPGIMVTASHNPREYNGFKMAFDSFGNACGKMIQDFRIFTESLDFIKGNGIITEIDIKNDYLNLVKNSIDLGKRKIKVVVDAANATGSIIAPSVMEMFKDKIEFIPLYMDLDPTFPNHHPDPCVEKNNEMLKKKVKENNADLGIGLDGDADRVGIIDENGNMIYIDLLSIIIWRDIFNKVNNKSALFDVKCSKSLQDELIKLGIKPVCYRTGNSYMKAKMKNDNFDFGAEYSGHVFFNDKWPNIDDGLYAGLRIIEILSKTKKSLSNHLDGINKYCATPEIKIKTTDSEKFKQVDKVLKYCAEKGYDVNDIDGARVTFNDGWALVRASNTGPDITVRFEATNNNRLEEIKEEFMSLI